MFNELITFLRNVDIGFLDALISVIVGVIVLITVFFGIIKYVRPNKEFPDLFLYCKAKDLQQEDFGIQPPSDAAANREAYWERDSDEEIEKPLKAHENVLVLGMPKMGKTRSVYQALKAALPDFYVITVPPRKVDEIRFPLLKKNYLVFFDDLNEFVKVKFEFNALLKEFRKRSRNLIVVATCRSGDEYNEVKENSMQTLREFPNVVNLDDYVMDERDGEALAGKANVPWRPEQFLGTPGSVVLDIEDMKIRYRSASEHEKCVLRSCKLLTRASIFVYKKELIRAICDTVFETSFTEDSWITAINHLSENSLVTMASIPRIEVYDPTLETVVDDYDPVYHLESLLTILIRLKDADNLSYIANAFYDDKDYDKAEKSLKECLSINSDYARAHYNLGILFADSGRYPEAETEFRAAIRVKPDYADAHNNLGVLLADLERYPEAEQEFKEVIRINSDYAGAHCNLGNLLQKLERYPEAEREYKEVIRINPDLAVAHNNFGILLQKSERNEEAETEYKAAIRINSNYAEAHHNLGVLLQNLERYPEAETEYKETIRINPDLAEAHFNLGILYSQTERLEDAREELETAKRQFEEQGKAKELKMVEKLLKPL